MSVLLRCRRLDSRPMADFLPWAVEDAALAITGQRLSARFSRGGDLMVSARAEEAEALLTLTDIQGVGVEVSRPLHLNRSQGSIRAPELAGHSKEDLLDGLSREGVVDVYRPPGSAVLVLTFSTREVPNEIRVAFLQYKVRVVVPRPRRCTRCQRYGHRVGQCRAREPVCAICAETGHSAATCEATLAKCAACGGPHLVDDAACPRWLLEKRVSELIAKDGWAPAAARRQAIDETQLPPSWPAPRQSPRARLGSASPTDLREFPGLPRESPIRRPPADPRARSYAGTIRPNHLTVPRSPRAPAAAEPQPQRDTYRPRTDSQAPPQPGTRSRTETHPPPQRDSSRPRSDLQTPLRRQTHHQRDPTRPAPSTVPPTVADHPAPTKPAKLHQQQTAPDQPTDTTPADHQNSVNNQPTSDSEADSTLTETGLSATENEQDSGSDSGSVGGSTRGSPLPRDPRRPPNSKGKKSYSLRNHK